MSEIVCIDEFREGPSRYSSNLRYEIRVGEEWVQWVSWAVPALLGDAVIHTDRNGWRYATPVPDEPEPVCASLEVAAPPRIVGYQVVARDSISNLELMVNQMIGYGWQPYGTPITTHGFWYQPMVKRATSGTVPDR